MKQTTELSNRALRAMKADQARSEAINRFMAQCQEEATLARQDMYVYCGIAAFFCLIAFSAIAGLNA